MKSYLHTVGPFFISVKPVVAPSAKISLYKGVYLYLQYVCHSNNITYHNALKRHNKTNKQTNKKAEEQVDI